jgi:hypothetical protein
VTVVVDDEEDDGERGALRGTAAGLVGTVTSVLVAVGIVELKIIAGVKKTIHMVRWGCHVISRV